MGWVSKCQNSNFSYFLEFFFVIKIMLNPKVLHISLTCSFIICKTHNFLELGKRVLESALHLASIVNIRLFFGIFLLVWKFQKKNNHRLTLHLKIHRHHGAFLTALPQRPKSKKAPDSNPNKVGAYKKWVYLIFAFSSRFGNSTWKNDHQLTLHLKNHKHHGAY